MLDLNLLADYTSLLCRWFGTVHHFVVLPGVRYRKGQLLCGIGTGVQIMELRLEAHDEIMSQRWRRVRVEICTVPIVLQWTGDHQGCCGRTEAGRWTCLDLTRGKGLGLKESGGVEGRVRSRRQECRLRPASYHPRLPSNSIVLCRHDGPLLVWSSCCVVGV